MSGLKQIGIILRRVLNFDDDFFIGITNFESFFI